MIGTKCPSIEGLDWLKGDPTPVPAPGKPMIIEFWASWCAPCRQVFPHLTDVARKNKAKGLVVVGITNEKKTPMLDKFVAGQGYGMDYTVAHDGDGEGQEKLIMQAGARGIPHAFVVDREGTILYSGHPMQPEMAKAIEKAVEVAAPPPEPLPLLTATREELQAMPIRELKALLTERGLSTADVNEKRELVDRILELCTRTTYYKKA